MNGNSQQIDSENFDDFMRDINEPRIGDMVDLVTPRRIPFSNLSMLASLSEEQSQQGRNAASERGKRKLVKATDGSDESTKKKPKTSIDAEYFVGVIWDDFTLIDHEERRANDRTYYYYKDNYNTNRNLEGYTEIGRAHV